MRSLSIRKVAAVAVGAAMVGAAFAGAVVDEASVGNYPFFSNGEPNVKIVVGSAAQISDGVAAANLAALIGNLAYSDVSVSGGATGGDGAVGTVNGKTVSLEVTTPAGVSGQQGTADVKTQLFDFLDVSQAVAGMTRNDDAKALVGDGVTTGGYKFGATNFPEIAFKGTVAGTGTYDVTQEDSYFVNAKSYYDTTEKTYVMDTGQITVVSNFTAALPYHVDTVNGTVANRPTNDAYITENRNVKVRFLGEDYVVTDFENTTTNAITLGKESKFLQMKNADEVKLGDVTVKLVSISPIATTTSTLPSAYFEILQNGTRLDYFSMDKNTANYNKNGIILDVRDVFVGSGDNSYAEVSVYSASLTLTSGSKINFEGDTTTTKLNDDAGWTATLTFTTTTVGSTAIKSLKTIQLSGRASNKLKAGESVNLIVKPVSKSLTFLGVETGVDSDTLTVSARGTQRDGIHSPASTDLELGVWSGSTVSSSTSNPLTAVDVNTTELLSSKDNSFDVNNGGVTVNKLYIDEYNGRIFYKDTSNSANSSYLRTVGLEGNVVTYNYPATKLINAVQLYTNDTRNYTYFTFNNTNSTGLGTDWGAVVLPASTNVAVSYTDTAGGESQLSSVGGGGLQLANVSWGTVSGASFYTVYVINSSGVYNYSSYTGAQTELMVGNNVSGVIRNTTAYSVHHFQTKATKLRVFEADTDNSATLNGYFEVDLNATDSSYLLVGGGTTTTTLTVPFRTTAAGINSSVGLVSGTGFEQGFISPYGTKLDSVGLSSVVLKYPQRMLKATYRFGAPSNVNVTAEGSVVTTKPLNEAESYSIGNGYSLKVKTITGEAVCAGGAGGAAVCTPATANVVTPLNPASDPLVVLDRDAGSASQLIVVGGPIVNTVAASTPGSEVYNTPGTSEVMVVGDKVLVAGYTAADTRDAVNDLINWLNSKRDDVRGV